MDGRDRLRWVNVNVCFSASELSDPSGGRTSNRVYISLAGILAADIAAAAVLRH